MTMPSPVEVSRSAAEMKESLITVKAFSFELVGSTEDTSMI